MGSRALHQIMMGSVDPLEPVPTEPLILAYAYWHGTYYTYQFQNQSNPDIIEMNCTYIKKYSDEDYRYRSD